jgi:prepilin-type N-terminal cleavage/methylation domain-containing protein
MNNKSFTVIELLVVIAIIGVLASIVLVSLSGTRDRAQIAKTLLYSNQVYHSLGADIVGNWDFDEGSGTTALDSSGYYSTGTIMNGASYTTDTPQKAAGQGAGKYALSFDGSNDYVRVADKNILDFGTGDFTLSLWFKTNGNPSAESEILSKYSSVGYVVYINTSGVLYFYIRDGSNLRQGGPSGYLDNKWHHVAVTSDYDGYSRIYVDGALKGSSNTTFTAPISNSIDLTIGSYTNGTNPFLGLIDEVRIYSAALTSAEIQKLYAEGAASHGIAME